MHQTLRLHCALAVFRRARRANGTPKCIEGRGRALEMEQLKHSLLVSGNSMMVGAISGQC